MTPWEKSIYYSWGIQHKSIQWHNMVKTNPGPYSSNHYTQALYDEICQMYPVGRLYISYLHLYAKYCPNWLAVWARLV